MCKTDYFLLNTQLFTNNNIEASFYQAGELCDPHLNLSGDLPSINQGVVGFAIEMQHQDVAKLEFSSSYTFGGISSVAEIDLSFEYSF